MRVQNKGFTWASVFTFETGHPPPNKARGRLDRKSAPTNGAPVTRQSKHNLFLPTQARGAAGLARPLYHTGDWRSLWTTSVCVAKVTAGRTACFSSCQGVHRYSQNISPIGLGNFFHKQLFSSALKIFFCICFMKVYQPFDY